MTSEDEYCIIPQPREMCPVIDDLIELAELNEDPDRVEEMRSKLQYLRSGIESLRCWGQMWKDTVKERANGVSYSGVAK